MSHCKVVLRPLACLFFKLSSLGHRRNDLLKQGQDVRSVWLPPPTQIWICRYISRSLRAIFSSSRSQRKGMTSDRSKNEGFSPKAVCLSCGPFGAGDVAAGNTFPSHTHAHTPEVCDGSQSTPSAFWRRPHPTFQLCTISGLSTVLLERFSLAEPPRCFFFFLLRRLNSVSRTEEQVCLGQQWE